MNQKFLKEISKIKDPEIFLGIARVLNVALTNEEDEPYSFADILSSVMEHYSNLSRKGKRKLFKILKSALED